MAGKIKVWSKEGGKPKSGKYPAKKAPAKKAPAKGGSFFKGLKKRKPSKSRED
mgnify:CR=1 FL=1